MTQCHIIMMTVVFVIFTHAFSGSQGSANCYVVSRACACTVWALCCTVHDASCILLMSCAHANRSSRKHAASQQRSYTLDTKFWRDPGVANFKVRGTNYLRVSITQQLCANTDLSQRTVHCFFNARHLIVCLCSRPCHLQPCCYLVCTHCSHVH